ncbi:hypothetical protein CDCA_CDCA14G3902 [Cyanidium caldarium]|uniref:Uncharacterized protein n=1 Tax=Cyanidium caldarium TaxID=2771 RepID=A0AAV9IZY7_CYACA|nr:hypothetical protein CDCA_CDCA14G3902 [Cyanidium caldarium]
MSTPAPPERDWRAALPDASLPEDLTWAARRALRGDDGSRVGEAVSRMLGRSDAWEADWQTFSSLVYWNGKRKAPKRGRRKKREGQNEEEEEGKRVETGAVPKRRMRRRVEEREEASVEAPKTRRKERQKRGRPPGKRQKKVRRTRVKHAPPPHAASLLAQCLPSLRHPLSSDSEEAEGKDYSLEDMFESERESVDYESFFTDDDPECLLSCSPVSRAASESGVSVGGISRVRDAASVEQRANAILGMASDAKPLRRPSTPSPAKFPTPPAPPLSLPTTPVTPASRVASPTPGTARSRLLARMQARRRPIR